jgi:hypothetical protein
MPEVEIRVDLLFAGVSDDMKRSRLVPKVSASSGVSSSSGFTLRLERERPSGVADLEAGRDKNEPASGAALLDDSHCID